MQGNRSVYRQQDQSDCGVACLLSVIQYYRGISSLENLRRFSGTTTSGTTLLGLYEAATLVGFDASGCKATIADLLVHDQPLILHVTISDYLQHYVVCFGHTKNKLGIVTFKIGDPARGLVDMSVEDLSAIWHSQTCLTLKPNEKFVTAKARRAEKSRWLVEILKDDLPILGLAACMGLLVAAMSLSMAVFSQKLIDDFLPGKKAGAIYAGVLLVGIILLIREGLTTLRQWLLVLQGRNFNSRVMKYFFPRLLHLPMPFFDSRKIGDLTARLNDTARIQRVVTQIVSGAIIQLLVVVVSITFLFTYSGTIAVSTLVISPIFFVLAFLYRHQILTKQNVVMQGNALTEANYISTIQGIGAIKNHNQQSDFAKQNEQVYGGYQEAILQLGKLQIKISLLVNVSSNLFLMVLLAYGSSLVLSGQMKAGELMATLSLAGGILPGVAGLALLSIPLSEAMVAIDRMYEFTGLETEDDSEKDNTIPLTIASLQVNNLSFRFPGRGPLLKNINLSIEKGEIIGLIGENGCGKSTLVQLLLKHYRPGSGFISINNGTNIQSIANKVWRTTCSVVPQHVHLFNGTILQNIAFGDAGQNSSKVLEFLDKNGFASLLNTLPQGVYTLIGDEGMNLSGGQRQLVGIARALYANPQFLILDESTSAMDMLTEQFVINLLEKLRPDMGVIFITHRLHILKQTCQRICIMQQGTIPLVGTHEELMQSSNLYSRYWEQLLWKVPSKIVLP